MTAELAFTGIRPAAMLLMQDKRAPLETAMFTASAKERHPQLGGGALLRLALPLKLTQSQAAETAARLNWGETTQGLECQFLGAWCLDQTHGVRFVTFLPAAIHRQGILNMMVFDAALRARWAHQLLGNHPV